MSRVYRPIALVLCAGLAATFLVGDENIKHPAEVAATQHVDFAPGGVIKTTGLSGDLYIEGWDQPQVELTVKKFMPYDYSLAHPERGAQQMEATKITAERHSAGELAITVSRPEHMGFIWHPTAETDTSQVRLETHVFVPRNSSLKIQHGVGLVSITNVTGDIQAHCSRGDILLWLPESGSYAIDARSKLGKVYSDFPGSSRSRFLVGQGFASAPHGPPLHLTMRVGFGGITLKRILPESEPKRSE